MAEITKLNNFGSTKGINLKLIPVIVLDNRRRHQHSDVIRRVIYRPKPFFDIWSVKYTPDDVTMLMRSSIVFYCLTSVSLVLIPLVDPEI